MLFGLFSSAVGIMTGFGSSYLFLNQEKYSIALNVLLFGLFPPARARPLALAFHHLRFGLFCSFLLGS